MNRKELMSTLEGLAPALEKNKVLGLNICFFFTGNTIIAAQDGLILTAPFECEHKFATNGPLLLSALKALEGEEITFKPQGEYIMLSAKDAEYALAHHSVDDFYFTIPDIRGKSYPSLLGGIKTCLFTCSKDTALGGRRCIGFAPFKGKIAIYSSNDVITRYVTECSGSDFSPCFVDRKFCDVISDWEDPHITFSEGWLKANSGKFTAYGQCIELEGYDVEDDINKILPTKITMVPIPDGFSKALARAQVLTDVETVATTLLLGDGIGLHTANMLGEVVDTVNTGIHPEIEIKVSAELVQKSLDGFNQFMAIDSCIIVQNDNTLRLISNLTCE